MNHKVLIVTYYWPPSGDAGVMRYLKFAKYLPQFGIKPYVLTVENPHYPITDPTLARDIPEDIPVFKSKTSEPFSIYAKWLKETVSDSTSPVIELSPANRKKKFGLWIRANLFVPDGRIGWLLTARSQALSLIKDYQIDTIITTGTPHSVHLVGKYVKKKLGVRWLADFRDVWSQIHYNKILPKTSFAQKLDEKLERSVLNAADEIIVVSKSHGEEIKKCCNRNYKLITNGFDPNDFANLRKECPDSAPYIFRYIGRIDQSRVPETFFKALARLGKGKIKVEFIGTIHPRVEALTDKYNLGNTVSIRSYMPHRKALQQMCSAHYLLLLIPNKNGAGASWIPGKLYEYLASGKQILLLGPGDGDAAKIINEQKAGIVCAFDDAEAIHETLLRLIQKIPPETEERELSSFSRITLTQQLAALIKKTRKNYFISRRDKMLPNFLGLGVPKAGTTWMHRLLASHPEVWMPKRRKEINFFSENYERGHEWYSRFFPATKYSSRYRAVGEISPGYFFNENNDCVKHIDELASIKRFILILRNPVDRVFSAYCHRVRNYNFSESFEEFLNKYPQEVGRGFYAKHLRDYLKHFDREQFLILLFEQIFENLSYTKQRLANFLEINPILFPSDAGSKKINRTYFPKYQRTFALAQKGLRVMRRWEMGWLLEYIHRSGIGPLVKHLLGEQSDKETLLTINPEAQKNLYRTYADDILQLEDLTDLELSIWKQVPDNDLCFSQKESITEFIELYK